MDYNEDRWGPVSWSSRNVDTFEKDVLENNIGDIQREESAKVYFQNIGTFYLKRNQIVQIQGLQEVLSLNNCLLLQI